MSTQTKPSNVYLEPSAADADTTPVEAFLQHDGTDFVFATSGPRDGAFVTTDDASVYELLDLRAPLRLIDGGGSLLMLSTSGDVAAVLVTVSGNIVSPSSDLTETPAAEFNLCARGYYPLTAPDGGSNALQLIAVGSTIQPFI